MFPGVGILCRSSEAPLSCPVGLSKKSWSDRHNAEPGQQHWLHSEDVKSGPDPADRQRYQAAMRYGPREDLLSPEKAQRWPRMRRLASVDGQGARRMVLDALIATGRHRVASETVLILGRDIYPARLASRTRLVGKGPSVRRYLSLGLAGIPATFRRHS